jgi:hypothetical protein
VESSFENTVFSATNSQFSAALQTLENAINACPETLWYGEHKVWYQVFHVLFFTDYYLSLDPKNFTPPSPFTDSEFTDTLPAEPYTKETLAFYLSYCKNKKQVLFDKLDNNHLQQRWVNSSETMNYSVLEILLYNMRHIQHHAAQINKILSTVAKQTPEWVYDAYQ